MVVVVVVVGEKRRYIYVRSGVVKKSCRWRRKKRPASASRRCRPETTRIASRES